MALIKQHDDAINNFSAYEDFNEYCKQTNQNPAAALNTILEYIDFYKKEIQRLQGEN